MDVVRKAVLYVVKRLGEVDVKRLMYVMYLIDRELYYVAGFTLFSWKFTFGGLRSLDVYDVLADMENRSGYGFPVVHIFDGFFEYPSTEDVVLG